ncbi:MAG: hypothetical protein AB7V32_06890 [Candidatus Berkiella sp.]
MRVLYLALILGLTPITSIADTTLYACTMDGKTTLQSEKPEKCDILKTYHYTTTQKSSEQQSQSSLRPEEIRQLETPPLPYGPSAKIRRYENVDERIGYADLNNYVDSIQDKCAAYRRQLESALFYIQAKNDMMIEIGPYQSASLAAQINQALPQVNYYCR